MLISIHAPRTGSDVDTVPPLRRFISFQSTLPARGATWVSVDKVLPLNNFNPRSPHGERLKNTAGVDIDVQFQSTLPARGATPC